MPTRADRQRDKLTRQGCWRPSDEGSPQLSVQGTRDRFDSHGPFGLRQAGMDRIAQDASNACSFNQQFTGNLS